MRFIDRNALVACLVALVLRVVFALIIREPTDTGDMAAYNALAVGGVLTTAKPPLYPLFLRVVYLVFGMHRFTAVYVVQGVMSCIVVIAIYHWAIRFFDRTVASLAAVISAVYPNFILNNVAVLPHSLNVTLIVSITAVSVSEHTRLKSIISALLTGAGWLVSHTFAFFVPGLAATARRKPVFIAVLVATLAPWIVRNAFVRGVFVPVCDAETYNVGLDLFGKARDAWDMIDIYYYRASVFMGKGWHSYVMDGTFSRISYASHVRTFSYAIMLLLGLTGLIRYYRKEHRVFLLPFLGYIVLIGTLSSIQGSYRVVLEPVLIIYAAVLIVNEYRSIREKRGIRSVVASSGVGIGAGRRQH